MNLLPLTKPIPPPPPPKDAKNKLLEELTGSDGIYEEKWTVNVLG